MKTTQPDQIPDDLFAAVMVAQENLKFMKALIKVGDLSTTQGGKERRSLRVNFIDRPASVQQGRNIWRTLDYTLWEKAAVTTGDFLREYADAEGRLTCLVAFDINDIEPGRAYTKRDGEEVQPYQLKWMLIAGGLGWIKAISEQKHDEDDASPYLDQSTADEEEEV